MGRSQSADKKGQSRQYFVALNNIPVEGSVNFIFIGDLISGKVDNSVSPALISIDVIIRDERLDIIDLKIPNKKIKIISEIMFNCLAAIQSPFERIRCSKEYAEKIKEFKIGSAVKIRVPDNKSPQIYGVIRAITNQSAKGIYFGIEVCSNDRTKSLDEVLSMYEDGHELHIESKTRPFIQSLQFKIENSKSIRVYARINVLELCNVSLMDSMFNWCKERIPDTLLGSSRKRTAEPKYVPIAPRYDWINIGDEIEVQTGFYDDTPTYIDGQVVWIGKHKNDNNVLILIETDLFNGETDGVLDGYPYYNLRSKTGKFVDFKNCYRKNHFFDKMTRRVEEASLKESTRILEEDSSETVENHVQPICFKDSESVQKYCGMKKGIQGHINSCYMDATLFSVFASTSLFDAFLICERDDPAFEKVRMILSTEIVYPLRKNGFVAQSKVTKLRGCLSDLLSDASFISAEKDPEEFLSVLLGKVFNYDVKLKLSSNQETYCFQLFAEKNDKWTFPTVEQLFKQTMITNKLKIVEVPQYLILQMPRYGTEFKMYNNIFPSPIIDLSDLITDYPRRCCVCKDGALIECLECFEDPGISFCDNCYNRTHSGKKKSHHIQRLNISPNYKLSENNAKLELLSVICIETSHYVSFTKMGSDSNTWVFFDSMAQRVEGAIGRNTPSVTKCDSLRNVLKENRDRSPASYELRDEMTKRLVRDVYYCIYQNRNTLLLDSYY